MAQPAFNNNIYMSSWNHDMGANTIVLPSIASIQQANYLNDPISMGLLQQNQMDHIPDNNDQEFHLQLQYAVSESLHSIQQQI